MKTRIYPIVLAVAVAVLAWLLPAAANGAQAEDDQLYSLMAGAYELVGRYPDSGRTYTGHVQVTRAGQGLRAVRSIGGRNVTATGHIDRTAADQLRILKFVFAENGQVYEASYLAQMDYDNYPRLSGYVYLKNNATKKVGLEAWFSDHGQLETE